MSTTLDLTTSVGARSLPQELHGPASEDIAAGDQCPPFFFLFATRDFETGEEFATPQVVPLPIMEVAEAWNDPDRRAVVVERLLHLGIFTAALGSALLMEVSIHWRPTGEGVMVVLEHVELPAPELYVAEIATKPSGARSLAPFVAVPYEHAFPVGGTPLRVLWSEQPRWVRETRGLPAAEFVARARAEVLARRPPREAPSA